MSGQGWWYRASQEQKLRQLDAGLALGMTAKQIAIVSGVDMTSGDPRATVTSFGYLHGRAFRPALEERALEREAGWGQGRRPALSTKGARTKLRRAYESGARDFSDAAVATFTDEAA